MKRFLSLLAVGAVAASFASSADAQVTGRTFSARNFQIDDNVGHTMLIGTPPVGSIDYTIWQAALFPPLTFNFPVPPTTTTPSGFVNRGSAAGNLLYWIPENIGMGEYGQWAVATGYNFDNATNTLQMGTTTSKGHIQFDDGAPANAFTGDLRALTSLTANRTWDLPDASGIISLGGIVNGTVDGSTLRWDSGVNKWVENTLVNQPILGGLNVTGAVTGTTTADFAGTGTFGGGATNFVVLGTSATNDISTSDASLDVTGAVTATTTVDAEGTGTFGAANSVVLGGVGNEIVAADGTINTTSGLNVNGGMFTVNATNGNTLVAGTLDQTAGQVTLNGNVDAKNGLDVTTANLTVGGANFTVAPATGLTTSAGGVQITGEAVFAGDAGTGTVSLRAKTTSGGSWDGAGAFGGAASTVILGESAGIAQIAGHNGTLSAWTDLYLNSGGGKVRVGSATAPASTLDVTGSLENSGNAKIATAATSTTEIGNVAGFAGITLGNVAAGTGNITLNSSVSGDIVLNGVDADAVPTEMLTLTNAGKQVRVTTLSGSADEGVIFSTGKYRLGGATSTEVPFASNRFVNLNANNLSFTRFGGAETALSLTGGTGGAVGINTGSGNVTAGNATGTTAINGANVNVTGVTDVTGVTTINTTLAAGATTLGNSSNTLTLYGGNVNIAGMTDVNGNTTINTTNGDGTTSIGNTTGTLVLNGSTVASTSATTTNVTAGTALGLTGTNVNIAGVTDVQGATTINTTGAATTSIGSGTGGNVTIGVQAAGASNLIVNNLQTDPTPTQMLTLNGSNQVKATTLSGSADEGVIFSTGKYRLGGATSTEVPFASPRFINTTAGNGLNFTHNGGTASGSLNGTTGQWTFNTNVDATLGLDVTGANLTVGGANIVGTTAGVLTGASTLDFEGTGTFGASNMVVLGTAAATNEISATDGTINTPSGLDVNAGKFTVASATGNTVVGGTLNVTGATTLSSTLDVTGTTNINTAGGAATNIGNATLPLTITGTTNLTSLTASHPLQLDGSKNITSNLINLSDNTNTVTGIANIANGGTNSGAALTANAVMVSNGTQIVQGPQGTTTTVLHGNAAGLPTYSAVDLTTDVTGVLPVANGGTGAATLASNGVVFGNGTSAVGVTTAGTNGQVLIGNSAGAPAFGTVTLGTTGADLNFATGANTLQLNVPDAGTGVRGVVSTGVQTFAGAKTFTSALTASAAGNTFGPGVAVNGTYITVNGANNIANYEVDITGDLRATGTANIGTLVLTGNLLPTVDNTQDIGEITTPLRWRKVYVGPGSFHTYGTALEVGGTARDWSAGITGTGNYTVGEATGGTNRLTLTPAGALTTAAGITASTGDIATTVGNITSAGTVTGATGLIATTGGVLASAGNVTATLGNINAAAGTLQTAGTTRIANNGDATLQATTTTTLGATGLITGSLGATVTGAAVNLNAGATVASNFATNINNGTSTGTVGIGNSLAGAIGVITGSTFDVSGTTNVNVGVNKATNINTGANTSALTLGNSTTTTTTLNGSTTNINTGVASTTNIGIAGATNSILGTTGIQGITNINTSGNFATNIATAPATGALGLGNTSSPLTLKGSSVDVTGPVTSANSITITNGGLTVTAGGAQVTAGGITVSAGGLQVNAGGATIVGNTGINTTGSGVTQINTTPNNANLQLGNLVGGVTMNGNVTIAPFATAGIVHNAAGGLLSSSALVPGDISLAQGSLIVGNASNVGAALAIGANNTLAISNGTTLAYGLIADANVGAAAAIAGTKISPDFGAQAVTTTGNISTTTAGTITSAGLLTGSAGLTVTGTTNINTTGTANTSIGNATGTLTLLGGPASVWGVTSAGAGTLTSLDAGSGTIVTTGAVNGGTTTITGLADLQGGVNLGNAALDAIALNGTMTLSATGSIVGGVNLISGSNFGINGGAIDGTPIGATTPAAGTFTSLTANTNLTLNTGVGTNSVLTEGGLDKSSAVTETFAFANSGVGVLDVSVDGNLSAGSLSLSGNLDMATNIITNIGNVGTDFVAATGGLNLAGDLNIGSGKFTAAAATGNTLVGGTLDVSGVISSTAGNVTITDATDITGATNINNTGAATTNIGTSPAVGVVNIGNTTSGTAIYQATLNGITNLTGNVRGAGANRFAERVATTATLTQVIPNTLVTATSVIIVTYEDPAGGGFFSAQVDTRVVGTSFTVRYGAAPPAGSFLNYMIINP